MAIYGVFSAEKLTLDAQFAVPVLHPSMHFSEKSLHDTGAPFANFQPLFQLFIGIEIHGKFKTYGR